MIFAAASIVFAWSALLGVAYLVRIRFGQGRKVAIAVVAAVYAVLAVMALLLLGRGWPGWAGAAGMLVPFAVASLLACRPAASSASAD